MNVIRTVKNAICFADLWIIPAGLTIVKLAAKDAGLAIPTDMIRLIAVVLGAVCLYAASINHTAYSHGRRTFRPLGWIHWRSDPYMHVLRTEADWEVYLSKLALNATGAQPRNMEWAILNSCIMGYRAGRWDISGLGGKKTEEKCAWINDHNTSDKKFTPFDWKNARRPERQVNMLPLEIIKDKLNELMTADA